MCSRTVPRKAGRDGCSISRQSQGGASGRQQDLVGRAELGWVTGVQAETKSGQGRRRSAWGQRSEEEESEDHGCGDG